MFPHVKWTVFVTLSHCILQRTKIRKRVRKHTHYNLCTLECLSVCSYIREWMQWATFKQEWVSKWRPQGRRYDYYTNGKITAAKNPTDHHDGHVYGSIRAFCLVGSQRIMWCSTWPIFLYHLLPFLKSDYYDNIIRDSLLSLPLSGSFCSCDLFRVFLCVVSNIL